MKRVAIWSLLLAPCAAVAAEGEPTLFESRRASDSYRVEVAGQSCQTPCMLYLKSGHHELKTSGSGRIAQEIDIQPGLSRISLLHTWNNEIIIGTTLMSLGTAMMLSNLSLASTTTSASVPSVVSIIIFGWAIGPLAHLVGVLTIAIGSARFTESNRLLRYSSDARQRTSRRPALTGLELTPLAHGALASVALRY